MSKIELLTLGMDAEMFLKNKETNEVISSEGYIKGSKHRPRRFDKSNKWFTTQLDNVLTEFTIPPAKTPEEFLSAVHKAMQHIRGILPENIEPLIQASANLDEKYLQTEQAMMFGCEPDFNAYTRFINEKPECEDPTLRSCGAHIHLGYKGVEVKFNNDIYGYAVDPQRASIVQVLDLFISVPLVVMEPSSERKRLYGKAGAFRPKPYGLEYRTPSNWYLTDNNLVKWVFNSTKEGFDFFVKKGELPTTLANHVQSTINTNNRSAAKDLIKDFKLQLA